MLPRYLQSSYRLYKQDTDDVATWLAETARSTGYSSEAVLDETRHLRNEPKKENTKIKAKIQHHQEQSQHIVPIREFSSLATHITQHITKAAKVPLSILHKLQRTIDARRECSLWFQVNEKNKKSDESHSHFLEVLQQVFEILNPHSSLPLESTLEDDQKVDNLFSHLHIEEPFGRLQQGQHTSAQAELSETGPEYQAETSKDKSEALFAGFSLFNDIARIYLFVTDMWKQYQQGTLDLITASVTTNTAIDLVQRIEEQFFEQFTSIEDPEDIIETIYSVKSRLMGKEPAPFDTFDKDLQDIVHFIYGDTLVLLKSLMDVMSLDSIPISKPGFFGIYKPQANREKMSARARFDEDKLILGELLPDFWMLAWNKVRTPWEDGLTRGFRTMLNSQKLPIWTMFAARIFLEVHHLLRSTISAPFKQLQALGKSIKDSWLLVIKMRDPSQATNWPPENDRKIYSDIFGTIRHWLDEDSIGIRIKKLVRGQVPVPRGEFRLLRQHPLMCGLLAFYLHFECHRAGISYANAMGTIIYTSHLYNASRQEGDCEQSWVDIELIIHMQSAERVFVGGKPETPEDYFKRFCLCMGYSAEQFASNRRQGGALAASRGPRTLAITGELSTILYEHYSKHTTGYLELVEELINSRFIVDNDTTDEDVEQREIATVAIKQRTKDETKAYLRRKFRLQSRLSPVEVLLAMKDVTMKEVPMLAFDYFHLHRSCEMVLDMIQKTFHDRFLKYFEAGYLETKAQLPFIVGYIFAVASSSHQLAARVGLRKPRAGIEVSSELLSLAGQLMQTLLTDQNFGPHCQQATSHAATDGRLMFSPSGGEIRVKPGTKVDFGEFELIFPG